MVVTKCDFNLRKISSAFLRRDGVGVEETVRAEPSYKAFAIGSLSERPGGLEL